MIDFLLILFFLDSGTSENLSVMIEGESLLNDGVGEPLKLFVNLIA